MIDKLLQSWDQTIQQKLKKVLRDVRNNNKDYWENLISDVLGEDATDQEENDFIQEEIKDQSNCSEISFIRLPSVGNSE